MELNRDIANGYWGVSEGCYEEGNRVSEIEDQFEEWGVDWVFREGEGNENEQK